MKRGLMPKEIWSVGSISRRELLHHGAAGTVLLGAGGLLAACGDDDDSSSEDHPARPPKSPPGVLRIANNGEPASFDPSLTGTIGDLGIVTRNVYDGLLNFGPNGEPLRPGPAPPPEPAQTA